MQDAHQLINGSAHPPIIVSLNRSGPFLCGKGHCGKDHHVSNLQQDLLQLPAQGRN
jgi:hypothetical protein